MSRILRRPMFRGGQVDSRGRGGPIPGGRVPMNEGGILDIYKQYDETIPMPERREPKGLSTGDYLRIASAGLDILGAPSEGPGFRGALASASGPLSKLGVDLGTSIDAREQKAEEDYQDLVDKRTDLVGTLTGADVEYTVGMAKANKKTATEIQLSTIDAYYNDLIEAENQKGIKADTIKIENLKKERDFSKLDVAQGGNKASKFRILTPATIEAAQDVVMEALGEEATLEEIQAATVKYLLGLVKGFDQGLSGLKDGGRVGKANGGITETADVNMMTKTPTSMTDVNVKETETVPAQTNEINISYDQLRDRLPPEVTDDIVYLLSQSYEALADFAEIQTQADVNEFNIKYNVQLFLPQQSGA